MNRLSLIGLVFVFILHGFIKPSKVDSVSSVLQDFKQIPESTQLAVYWYWVSDHISQDGVIKDLEAMKKVGINRVFIGSNIVSEGAPTGPHKIFSDEWWNILHAALKKATELNIEIGIFNSPGWSQSGGPWIEPKQSMRYLSSADTLIIGAHRFRDSLPSLGENAQDVKVLAYPANDYITLRWNVNPKKEQKVTLDMSVEPTEYMQSLVFNVTDKVHTKAKLYYKEGSKYTFLRKLEINRSNTSLNVGFDPLAPVVFTLPEIKTDGFRLEFEHLTSTVEVQLSSEPRIENYPEKTLAKMFQSPLPFWHVYMWNRQPESKEKDLISAKDVLDLTKYFQNQKLDWEVPEGKWKVMRLGMRTTGVTNGPASIEGTGLEVDKMSKKHVKDHFDSFIGEILRRIPKQDRLSFKVIVQDSYETGGQNWTDDMEERFMSVYGYSPTPYLPALQGVVVGSRDISDRFLWDLRRLIADRIAYDYVGGLRDIGHKYGLTTWLENYGHWGFPGEFLQYGGQSDEISGEFWSEGELGDIENRAASSAAHIYGKTKVWAESFTAAGKTFARTPYMMKQRGDRFFTEGINATLLHLYIHQPYEDRWPGMNAWFGNEFNRKNTWFEFMDVFGDYLKRCNLVLQRGQYVADVAYFIGEDVPKMTGVVDPVLPKGYSFDYINAEVIMEQATVKNGKLKLKSGMEYKVLVLPKQETMRPALLKKIAQMVRDGLVILGPEPKRSPSLVDYPRADKEISLVAQELWRDVEPTSFRKVEKGLVFGEEVGLEAVFDILSLIPDFRLSEDVDVKFIHRKLVDGNLYFISNQEEREVEFAATFRVSEGTPLLVDPLLAEIRLLPDFKQSSNSTTINLKLAPFGSAFVLFDKKRKTAEKGINFPKKEIVKELNQPWNVLFKPAQGPSYSYVFDNLKDWSVSKNDSIRYFSGTATYSTTFTIPEVKGKQLYLDVGKVMSMGKIYLNDKYVGGVWAPPYQVNITNYLIPGENKLEISVANNWINALIGDAHFAEGEKKLWTIQNPYQATDKLQESGLIGPITIDAADYIIRN